MDPLTHTLLGANLAATRLGDKGRFASAALVVGANFPDLDVLADFAGDDFSRGFRRGWTHGLLAHAVLPFVLAGILILIDRVRPGGAQRARPLTLLALSTLGIWTHPFLDWLNTYGMRWLMPFRPTWYYGDAVYIMDPWLWLILGVAWLAGRRPTVPLLVTFVVVGALIASVVSGRSSQYLPVVGAVAAVLLAALFVPAARHRRRLAAGALMLAAAYIGGRIGISEATEARVAVELARQGVTPVERMMVSPDPIDPRDWGFVAQSRGEYRFGRYRWTGGRCEIREERLEVAKDSPEWRAARRDPSVRGFMTWVRFPAYEIERSGNETRVYIIDARRLNRRRQGFGSVVVVLRNGNPAS